MISCKIRNMKQYLLLSLCVFTTACTSPSIGHRLPDITFQHLKPITVDVADVSYVNKAGNVSKPDDFYMNVPFLVESYIQQRYKAGFQNQNSLKFELEKVNVSYVQEGSENDFARLLNVAKHDKYRVFMTIHMIHDDISKGVIKGQRINVERIMSISEHVSLDERERRQMAGMEELFIQMDAAIIETLRDEFGIVDP